VLAALKADPDLADVPVVLLTMLDDRNKGFRLGAADYLVKPVDPDRLVDLLVPRILAGLRPLLEVPRKDPGGKHEPPKGLTAEQVQKLVEQAVARALKSARPGAPAPDVGKEVRSAVDEALKGSPSREDLTRLGQNLDKRVARVEQLVLALMRRLAERPAGAPPKDLDTLVRRIVREELAALRKQLLADLASLVRSGRGAPDRPGPGTSGGSRTPGAGAGGGPGSGKYPPGGAGKGRPVAPGSAGHSRAPGK
jgi:CheY-like chemotaxis protein